VPQVEIYHAENTQFFSSILSLFFDPNVEKSIFYKPIIMSHIHCIIYYGEEEKGKIKI